MIFRLDDLRENLGISIEKLDDSFIFYYDETNNIRKLYLLKEKYFNIGLDNVYKNFILGGVCFSKEIDKVKIDDLKKNLKLQKNIKEIKLKHIAKGNFLECLTSNKLNIFLKWLKNNSYIHFSSINFLFWSIVDIIDSAIYLYKELVPLHFDLKTVFYEIIKSNYEYFIDLFIEYEYPNIKREKANEFLDKLKIAIRTKYQNIDIDLLKIDKNIFNKLTEILLFLLEDSKNKELAFIMDEEDHILINDLSEFYLRPIYTFVNSKHIFDVENNIKKIFENYEFIYKDKKINIDFIDSKDNEFIQISDVLVGLIGKMYEYLNKNSLIEIENDLNNLNSIQNINIKLLKDIVIKSDKISKMFIHSIEPLTEKKKFEFIISKV